MSKSLPEPFAARPPQANTLKAKTDMTKNVRSADNPESEMDAHGKAAMTSDSDHGMKFAHPGRKKRKRGGMVEGAPANMHLGRVNRAAGGKTKGKGNTTINIVMPQGAGSGNARRQSYPRHHHSQVGERCTDGLWQVR